MLLNFLKLGITAIIFWTYQGFLLGFAARIFSEGSVEIDNGDKIVGSKKKNTNNIEKFPKQETYTKTK